jgi:polyisoprenyl-phosphate glycosyltransferase
MKKKKLISIVIPCYNEEENVVPLLSLLIKVMPNKYETEYIFVNDGSNDQTLETIKQLCAKNKAIKYISLTRNFGHQYALKAGLDHARGVAVITLDADLQHPPILIPKMLAKWEEGYQVVYTKRHECKDTGFLKNLTSKLFYEFINEFAETKIEYGAADFRLLDRVVVDFIKHNTESSIFLRGLVAWTGYKSFAIEYEPAKRKYGKSKYSVGKMLRLAIDAITSFSILPLRMASIIGFAISLMSGIYGLYAIGEWIYNKQVTIGWPSVIVSVLFIGGIQLMMLGIIGEYIGKIFMETKKRPLYMIKETNL